MPYIKQHKRDALDSPIKAIVDILKRLESDEAYDNNNEGNINYVFSSVLAKIYKDKGYAGVNAVGGVLLCTWSEFYRKLASPYEDQKERENGSVY